MRRNLTIMVLAAAGSLAVNGTIAHAEGAADASLIPSTATGAMLPPVKWNCELYVDEYRDFLNAGHKAADWRFVGKRYRTVDNGSVYDWNMWLEWESRNDCSRPIATRDIRDASKAAGAGGGGFGGMTAIGVVGGLLGVGAVAAGGGGGGGGSGSPSKSPG